MKAVVVGGHSRNIGKTSVMSGLIRGLSEFNWTAVKITQYGHGICSEDGEPCDCAPTEHPFVLTEETDASGRADTCRFLAVGARRSLWLRARQGQLGEALPLLSSAVRQDEWLMIESNSIMEFLEPSLYFVVLDVRQPDFKPSANKFLARAGGVISIESHLGVRAWPEIDTGGIECKPQFPVSEADYFSKDLIQFVRQCILSAGPTSFFEEAWNLTLKREHPCLH